MLPGIAGGAAKFDDSVMPWVTFTDPEIGRVGLTEQEAFTAYGERARVAVVRLDEMDRPRTAGHSDGYIKLIAGPRKVARSHVLDRIVGFAAVTPSGGELAAQVALAMRTDMLAVRVAQAVAPYPTYALACGSPPGRSASSPERPGVRRATTADVHVVARRAMPFGSSRRRAVGRGVDPIAGEDLREHAWHRADATARRRSRQPDRCPAPRSDARPEQEAA